MEKKAEDKQFKFPHTSYPIRKVQLMQGRILVVIVLGVIISACGDLSVTSQTHNTPKNGMVLSSPTLPLLRVDQGWHAVIHASNAGANKILGGSFFATNPYAIVDACKGSGNITVQFSPQGTSRFNCNSSPSPRFSLIGTPQNLPKKELIHVIITSEGAVDWEVLVEIQD